ncbi:MAG: hypothetical protein WKF36_09200 [Candidatus Nitrosocosmicus sp.]
MSKRTTTISKTCFVMASIAISFILSISLFSVVTNNIASALDMSTIKQGASSLLGANNNTGSSSNDNATSGTTNDNTASSSSSLQQKATDAIGSMIK